MLALMDQPGGHEDRAGRHLRPHHVPHEVQKRAPKIVPKISHHQNRRRSASCNANNSDVLTLDPIRFQDGRRGD
jgi:hypothetical protein